MAIWDLPIWFQFWCIVTYWQIVAILWIEFWYQNPTCNSLFSRNWIKVGNTDSYIADDDTEEVCQIFKEDTSFEDTTSTIRIETDLVVSQSDEAGPSTSGSNTLLQPIRIPKRRRSPVTVQEWVASLPIPHLLATDR